MTISEYRDKVEAIISGANEKRSQYEQRLKELSAEIEAAEREAEQLFDGGNVAGYKKDVKKAADAKIEADMIRKKLDALRDDPLISAKEYEDIIKGIRRECDDLADQSGFKLLDLSNDAKKEGEQLAGLLSDAESILETLQCSVYRDPDGMRSIKSGIDGARFGAPIGINRGSWDVFYWANDLMNLPMYSAFSKKAAEQGADNGE